MTELLHMTDNYLKRFEAEIKEVTDEGVVLDRTAFYPLGGGVENDIGMLVIDGKKYNVTGVFWKDRKPLHILEGATGLKKGLKVNGEIDWTRRYRLMRAHTAAHVLEAMVFKKTGALIGSGGVKLEKSYLGFTLENMDKELIMQAVEDANKIIEDGAPVKIYFMKREEVLAAPDLVKLANKLPPAIKELRIVDIKGIDRQACGGPHVADIGEIGKIEVVKIENKGKNNRKLSYRVI